MKFHVFFFYMNLTRLFYFSDLLYIIFYSKYTHCDQIQLYFTTFVTIVSNTEIEFCYNCVYLQKEGNTILMSEITEFREYEKL